MDDNYPKIHVRPPANHINDPNGMIYYKNTYHVFIQYNPAGPIWGRIHWAHLSTKDFIHWYVHPIALYPDKGYDQEGCWSGCIIETSKGPALMYSAFDGKKTLPALAWGSKDLQKWEKIQENPVIKEWPEKNLFGFRDHKIFEKNGLWYQLIGSGINGMGKIFCYTSNDLLTWKYNGVWFTYHHQYENMIECPDYITFKNQSVLIYSTNDPYRDKTLQSYWAVGQETTENESVQFKSIKAGLLDAGCLYAPQSMSDGERVILIGWLREERSNEELLKGTWGGALSLPRELRFGEDSLKMYPIKELEKLRITKKDVVLNKNNKNQVTIEVTNGLLECMMQCSRDESNIDITILISSNSNDKFIKSTFSKKEIKYETNATTLDYYNKPVSVNLTSECKLHFFIDHSIIELLVNYEMSISRRMYGLGESLSVIITSSNLLNISYYKLKPIIVH